MKKLFLILLALLFVSPCFADQKVYVTDNHGNIVVPTLSGSVLSASNAIITSSGQILPFGTDTNIAKVIVNVPLGTAYIGDSGVTGSKSIALAATQSALVLDVNDLSTIYWTGPATQRISFIVIK